METLWNANYIKVWLTNFLMNFAFMLIVPLLPLYLVDTYGASKDTIGMVLFGYALAALCMRPFSGWIVDSFPRKTILLFFLVLTTFFFLGYLAAGSLLMFAFFRTLQGAPFGAMGVSLSTVAVDVLPSSRRTEGIGYYGLSNNIATAISPSVAILIYERYPSYDLLFLLCFCVSMLGVILCSTLHLKKSLALTEQGSRLGERVPHSGGKGAFLSLDRFFLVPAWALFLVMFTLGISYSIMSTYVAIYGREELDISGGTGAFFGLLAVGLIVSRLTGARSLRRGLVVRNANVGFIISLCGYILFALSSVTMAGMGVRTMCYFLAPLIIGLGNGHTWPAFQNMFINLAEHNQRGTANSTILTSWDLGMGAGMLLGGVLTEYLGFSRAFWVIVLLNATGAAFYYLFARGHYLRHKLR